MSLGWPHFPSLVNEARHESGKAHIVPSRGEMRFTMRGGRDEFSALRPGEGGTMSWRINYGMTDISRAVNVSMWFFTWE